MSDDAMKRFHKVSDQVPIDEAEADAVLADADVDPIAAFKRLQDQITIQDLRSKSRG